LLDGKSVNWKDFGAFTFEISSGMMKPAEGFDLKRSLDL
jgi:hypothetical protein